MQSFSCIFESLIGNDVKNMLSKSLFNKEKHEAFNNLPVSFRNIAIKNKNRKLPFIAKATKLEISSEESFHI